MAMTTGNVISQYCQVEDFSSQYGGENSISYTATNLSNESNIYPRYGDYTHACVLRTYGPWWKLAPSAPSPFKRTPPSFTSEDFIDISFHSKVYPSKLEIYETYNPGAVVRILACDCSPQEALERKIRWVTLWSGPPDQARQETRIFSPPLKPCPFPTNFLRLEFCHSKLYYYTELDAVKLHGTKSPPKNQCPIHDNSHSSSVDDDTKFSISSLCCCPNNRSAADDTLKWDKLSLEDKMSHMTLDGPPAVHKKDNGYFDSLPGEVIQLILSYLDVPSLCAASMTSTLFFHHCYDPLQYTEINLQPHWPLVSDSSLEYLESRCRHLQRLNLSWCGGYSQITTQGFRSFIKECSKELTCLVLGCCKFVNSECIQIIASSCNNLLELDLQCCPTESAGFLQIMKLSSLQRLNLYRTQIDIHSIVAIIRSCAELEHLNLGSCQMINSFDDVATELGKNCKNLKSLDFWRARTISDRGLEALGNNCPLLEEIELGWCPEIRSGNSGNCIVELIQKCRYLKKLFLCANRSVSDKELNALAQHSKYLEQLDILGTREVSINGVRRVLDNCKKLTFLDVSFCANVDFAFVEVCKTEYPHVNIKKSFQDS
ncbi:F-box/LRR-repeat protein 4 [Lingula anatina]|uniref:F-box/LRR-repeat protein 4 n=1 Tax=Lingula anatina TaxID=7574 RepID=A0A1S3IKW0_LINAN|nr:F-box/LRR-repeat protein 4 [Lingula anatina]|eukprot:XP_013398852.1 F-box/LRR-repeat protein 4 [Lingula anatina]